MFGPGILHGGYGSRSVAAAAMVVVASALGAGLFGYVASAFLACGLAWIIARLAGLVVRIEEAASAVASPVALATALGWLIDLVIVVLVVWRSPLLPWETWWGRGFAPMVLLLVLRLLPRALDRPALAWCEDRAVACIVLAVAAALGQVDIAIGVIVLVLLAGGLALASGPDRLRSP
jgi:hypothetical protein